MRHSKTRTIAASTNLCLLRKVRINEQIDAAKKQISSEFNRNVKKNREFLFYQILAVVMVATQGLTFRSHNKGRDSHNRGNYMSYAKMFHHLGNDKMLGEALYLEERPIFSGLFSDIENDLIKSVYDEVIY